MTDIDIDIDIDINEIQARVDAVSPGPWKVERWEDFDGKASFAVADVVRWRQYLNSVDCGNDSSAAEFIAHARTDVPALIAEVRRLREEYRLAHLDAIVNRDTANRADKTIERVRELHGVRKGMWGDGCKSCGRNLPCPTLIAIKETS